MTAVLSGRDLVRWRPDQVKWKERPAVKKVYQIAQTKDRRALQEFLVQHGQQLLPFVELIANAQLAVDEFIDVLGRARLGAGACL